MNSVHNMSLDVGTQHGPTRERASFSAPHTESSLCWFDRICSVIYIYQLDDSTVEVRVPTSLVTFPFLVWKLLSSLKRIKKCQVKINQIWTYAFICPLLTSIWYSIIIICCDQPIIWFMLLSSINLNQPTSLHHWINFFLFCDKILWSKHWRGFILACRWVYLAPWWVCQDGEGKSWQRELEASDQMASTVRKRETWLFILAHIFLFFSVQDPSHPHSRWIFPSQQT